MSQDNFTILELISQSSTTSVYKAHQNVLERTVLLKVLHKHLLGNKDLVSRFSREAKACAILRSENIVQVYDLTEVDGAPAILMEYVQGKSLEDTLLDESVRSEDFLLKVAFSVLNALRYAHDRGVTHRDIKPGNILISDEGTIKVTDFGLATVPDSPSLTMEGSLIGTPAYMSPEQARGETVDQRTDIFSLGVTLVEVLTGDKILAGRSYAECISKIQSFNLDSIDYLKSKCSPHTFEFLKRMLAPRKADRFASANEALRFLEGNTSVAAPVRSEESAARRMKPRVFIAGAIAGVIVILVGLSFVFRHPATKMVSTPPDTLSTVKPGSAAEEKTVPRRGSSIPGGTEKTVEKQQPEPGHVPGKRTGDVTVGTKPDTQQVVMATTSTDSGYISVHCTPWAKIYIDDEFAGTTPISGSIKMPVGEHTVTFNNQNFVPIVKQVTIRRNLLTSVDADFLRNAGYLIVSVNPWGKVYVDDQFRETTPSAQVIVVSAGTRRIRIQNPNFQDIIRNVTVNPGDTLRLSFDFESKGNK
ncbi:MAG: protein kinase [Bacteroidetes bacterium]|nr:protein kinase [Bacteroidota bacterium]